MSGQQARMILVALVLVGLVAAGSYLVAARRDAVTMRSGMAYSAGSISTVPIDGWTYGIPLDVAWTDVSGALHPTGRPGCLPPTTGPIGPITFGTVDVQVASATWRQVVWVSCQSY